jgi:hypothetical protein
MPLPALDSCEHGWDGKVQVPGSPWLPGPRVQGKPEPLPPLRRAERGSQGYLCPGLRGGAVSLRPGAVDDLGVRQILPVPAFAEASTVGGSKRPAWQDRCAAILEDASAPVKFNALFLRVFRDSVRCLESLRPADLASPYPLPFPSPLAYPPCLPAARAGGEGRGKGGCYAPLQRSCLP